MTQITAYDIANDSISLQFPLIGLALIIAGAVMKWGLSKPGWNSYALMGFGLFLILATGVVPWWDYRRVTEAVARGEARQVVGPIHGWRLARVSSGTSKNGDTKFYHYYEYFSVGPVAFRIAWDALEAGFANRGSSEKKPTVRLANGMPVRIWYLPIDGPDKPPRITRIDLGTGNLVDEAHVLPTERKERLGTLLDAFQTRSGYRLAVVTTSSLNGIDIVRYADQIAAQRGLNRAGSENGILLLVAPNERKARIAVAPNLTELLPDAVVLQIMDEFILPQFRHGDIPTGIEAGAAAIIVQVRSDKMR